MEIRSAFKKFGLRYYIDDTLVSFVVKSIVHVTISKKKTYVFISGLLTGRAYVLVFICNIQQ
jgi:hypothetical protein